MAYAAAVAADAAATRRRLRRRSVPGEAVREGEIEARLAEIREAMVPIRSLMGRLAYSDRRDAPEIRAVSRRLQSEAHSLRRMRRPAAA